MATSKSLEWLNSNLSRAYPLDDTTGGSENTLPSQLLTGATIVHNCAEITDLYISSIEVTDVGWAISLAFTARLNTGSSPANYTVSRIISVPFNSAMGAEVRFTRYADETSAVVLAGSFTIGVATAVSGLPFVTNFALEDTKLSDLTIVSLYNIGVIDPGTGGSNSPITEGNTVLKVGDVYLSGEVELIAGEGIEFIVDRNTLEIINTKYSIPEENLEIVNDQSLLQQLLEVYGRPVVSINGVKPNEETGDISIAYPKSAEDSVGFAVNVEDATTGRISITLTPDPCVDAAAIDRIIQNLSQLNIRAGLLDTGIKTVDTAINNVATQLTRLS